MIPNNKYYKDIAVILGYEWDNKHHSSLVYMKEIAMAYGYSYETTKPSNKFLKDWHTGLTGETPSDHKYNLWYLRGIAEFLGSSTGLNENQCLAYIKDNIENPPSEFDSIALTVATPILSYADGDSTSLTAQLMNGQEEAHLSGKSVSFDIIDSQGDVISNIGSDTTDSEGVATVTYTSTGIGDITIQASVVNDSDTYTDTEDIEDIWKYVGTDATTIQNALTSYTLYPMGSSTATVTTDGTDIILQSGNVGTNMWNRGELSFLNGFNNFSMSMIIKGGTGFGFHLHNNDKLYLFTGASVLADTYVNKNTWSAPSLVQLDSSKEYIMEMGYNSGTLLLKIFNLDGTEVLNTSRSVASNMSRFGFCYPKNTTQKFRDLKVKAVQSINISATDDVVSYVDGDYTTLTATINPVQSGKIVEIYQDDVLITTDQTDSNGQVSYDYSSVGIGDTVFKFKCGSIEETYTIEDCHYYNPNVISSATTVNISLPSAPFEVKYSVSVASNGGGTGFLRFNDASGFYTGKGSSANKNIYLNSQVLEQIPSLQTYYEYTMTYENGVATLTRDGNTVSESVASLTSLYLINSNYNTYVKGIKIKPSE